MATLTSAGVIFDDGTTQTTASFNTPGAVFYNDIFNGIATALDTQTFDSSGTWTKPASGTFALVEIWGAGGSGARQSGNDVAGGAGGGYATFLFDFSSLPETVTTTIGAGGPARSGSNGNGTAGGTSSFGSIFTATGGAGGGAASATAAGGTNTLPGSPYYVDSAFTFPASSTQSTSRPFSETGGAGASSTVNGGSVRSAGGGGGGANVGCVTVTTARGTSTFGGNGSSVSSGTAAAGSQPGGGGGGSYGTASGAGGAGRIKVTVY